MSLVDTKKMFEMAYKGGYAIGAFNINNMEITQGIVDAIAEEKAPLILQFSLGGRRYARPEHFERLVEAALENIAQISSFLDGYITYAGK